MADSHIFSPRLSTMSAADTLPTYSVVQVWVCVWARNLDLNWNSTVLVKSAHSGIRKTRCLLLGEIFMNWFVNVNMNLSSNTITRSSSVNGPPIIFALIAFLFCRDFWQVCVNLLLPWNYACLCEWIHLCVSVCLWTKGLFALGFKLSL